MRSTIIAGHMSKLISRILNVRDATSLIVMAVLVVASFTVHYYMAKRFERAQVYDQYNVLFNADPNQGLIQISHHWTDTRTAHPNFSNFLNPPVRVAAAVISKLGISDLTAKDLREELGLIVAPLLSALKTLLLFMTLRLLGLNLFYASLLTLLELVSFSSLIFGGLPEHFPVSGVLIAAMMYLAVRAVTRGGELPVIPLIVCGTLILGVTITNAAPFFFVLFLVGWKFTGPARTLTRLLWIGIAVAVLNAGVLLAGNVIYPTVTTFRPLYRLQHDPYFRESRLSTVARFPAALTQTVVAVKPAVADNKLGIRNDKRHKIMFTYEPPAASIGWTDTVQYVLIISVVALSAAGMLRGPPSMRLIGLACLGIIAFNWVVHSFYGDELFVYSLHWQVPLILLLAGLSRFGMTGKVLLSLLLLAAVSLNIYYLGSILATLTG